MEANGEPAIHEKDDVLVRAMLENDLQAVVSIDAAASGRQRPKYFELMIERAVKSTGLHVSLTAEMSGQVVGFVVASLYYGEYGAVEPSATIDTVGVAPAWRRKGVAQALLLQLRHNLGALRINSIRTEVAWDDFDLLAFLRHEGFKPAERMCLECTVDPTAPEIEEE